MGLIIKVLRTDGTLERVISKTGDVDVTFHKGSGHKPFMRFNNDPATDVDYSGTVAVFSEMGARLEVLSNLPLNL